MKYNEWLHIWLENYVKPSTKIRTYDKYLYITNHHILNKLGDYEMDDLSPIVIQGYITELLNGSNTVNGNGLSANSVNGIITVIQNSLKLAYTMGELKEYTANKIKRPKAKEKEISCFTLQEQKKIEQYILGNKKIKLYGVILCLYTGLRVGEIVGLEWNDIDFNKRLLKVNKTCHDGKNPAGVFTRIIDEPKTVSSKRIIPLPKQIMPLLYEMKKKSKSDYVISSKEKGVSVRSYQRSFELLLKKTNIPHKGFHSLRHTFATRALECGMDVKTLSEILGHKNPMVTLNRYVHSLMEHKQEMMNKLGKIF